MSAVPQVIGRGEHVEYDERASTHRVVKVTAEYVSGAIGAVSVELFASNGDEDRGGVVLRITSRNDASSFIPHAKNLPDGTELHLAGDAEGDALVVALQLALRYFKSPKFANVTEIAIVRGER